MILLLFRHSWEDVTLAVWLKYPNPFSSHVLASDILERRIDVAAGKIYTTRLMLKTSSLPPWIRRFYNTSLAYTLEESVVDLRNRTMTVVCRNLSHAKHVYAEEKLVIKPQAHADAATFSFKGTKFDAMKASMQPAAPSECSLSPSGTILESHASVTVHFGWAITPQIEGYLGRRLSENLSKSRMALQYVCDKLKAHRNAFPFNSAVNAVVNC